MPAEGRDSRENSIKGAMAAKKRGWRKEKPAGSRD
jgi:hypothetical protein